MITVNLIPANQIAEIWPQAGPLLAKAVEHCHGETPIEAVYDNLVSDATKLLAVRDGKELIAAVVLSIHHHPAKKICMISFAGGTRMEDWSNQGLPVVEHIAREAGADAVYIQGRRGWLRKFKEEGYSEYATLIGKELKR